MLFGVFFVGVLNDGLILMNVGPYYANLAVGIVLVLAAGSDAFYRRLERIPVQVDDARSKRDIVPASPPASAGR